MRRASRLLRSLAPYAANVGLAAVTSIAVIPVLTRYSGAHVWTVFAVGQSIGAAGAVVVGLSWPVTGAARAAASSDLERAALFRRSLRTRLPILISAVAAVWIVVIALGATSDAVTCALSATALLCSGMSNAWYFVGERRPGALLLAETLPRSLGTGVGLIAVLAGAPADVFLVVQLVGWAAPVLISASLIAARHRGSTGGLSPEPHARRRELMGASSSIVATAYVQIPTLVVAAVSPGSVPAFAVVDKILKFALTAVSPVTQYAQGHVPHGGADTLHHRTRTAATSALALGAVTAVVFTVAGPVVADRLTGGTIGIDMSWTAPFAVSFAAIIASGIVGLACLPAIGRDADLLRSILLGAVCGVPLCIALAIAGGGRGAAWAVAAAECLVLGWQIRALWAGTGPDARGTIRVSAADPVAR